MGMKYVRLRCSLLSFLMLTVYLVSASPAADNLGLSRLQPRLSADGRTMYNAVPVVALRVDPNPPKAQVSIPSMSRMRAQIEKATAFNITYIAAGGTDLLGKTCETFPDSAKAAFNAAAAIWQAHLNSPVPLSIKACWAQLGDASVLGYSGGGASYQNFSKAPLPNTWYASSLANAMEGTNLDTSAFDMHITYNNTFPWYYGTDSSTPAGQYDLMTVVLHEIAHGLNFSGTMVYSGGKGNWGSDGAPNIYDTFMKDGSGKQLITYSSGSAELGSILTANDVWFHGSQAMAANGGSRVKIYAPVTWAAGSSYAHLDYDTFSGTANRLMVYAISSGLATHDPGAVTLGIFKDMGWAFNGMPTVTSTAATRITTTAATSGGNVTAAGSTAVSARGVCWGSTPNPSVGGNCTSDGSGTGTFTSLITGLTANTVYYVRAYATNGTGTSYGSSTNFTTLIVPTVPTVLTTMPVRLITPNSATLGGYVTSDGGSPVTGRAVCWSTSPDQVIGVDCSPPGTGTGKYTSPIVGLAANTVYYVRAYATNGIGTSYGEKVKFRTGKRAAKFILYAPR